MYRQRFKTADQRFDEKYSAASNGCFIWITGKDNRHPSFRVGDGYIRASHFAWDRANSRKLREGEWVLHKCDAPKCVNPDHLFLGDQAANMQDRSKKGRGNHPRGERNGRARITRFMATEIRRIYSAGGVTQQKLADKFGLAQVTVSNIIRNTTWRE